MLFAILVYKGIETFFKLVYEWDKKQSVYCYIWEKPAPLDLNFSTFISKNSKKQTNSEIAASVSYLNESESTSF